MADNEFLKEDVEEENKEEEAEGSEEKEVAKVKVGDEEFDQDELKELVGLGKIGKEAEEKFDTKIDKVWPEFTKSRQELKELKEAAAKREEEVTQTKLTEGKQLSPEEQIKVAQEEARRLDLVLTPDLEKKIDERYQMLRAGEKIKDDAEAMVSEAQEKYGIKTSVKSILEHMAKPESPKHVGKAFKDMFEPQIDKWKEEQLSKKKGAGLLTEDTSTAGGKEPKQVKITRENVKELTAAVLRGE